MRFINFFRRLRMNFKADLQHQLRHTMPYRMRAACRVFVSRLQHRVHFLKKNYFIINFSINFELVRVIALSPNARNFQGSLSFSAFATIILEILLFTRLTTYQVFFYCCFPSQIFNLKRKWVWHTFFWWRDDDASLAIVFDDYQQCHETIA